MAKFESPIAGTQVPLQAHLVFEVQELPTHVENTETPIPQTRLCFRGVRKSKTHIRTARSHSVRYFRTSSKPLDHRSLGRPEKTRQIVAAPCVAAEFALRHRTAASAASWWQTVREGAATTAAASSSGDAAALQFGAEDAGLRECQRGSASKYSAG